MGAADKGYITAIPHAFPVHSHGGGRDQSASVVRRLMLRLFGKYQPYVNTKAQQPNEQRVQVNSYLAHYIGATTFIGQNAVACGPAPNALQNGMLYIPSESFPVTGLGGLVNGEMLGQELVDPNNSDLPQDLFA